MKKYMPLMYFEIGDRAHCINERIEDDLCSHPALTGEQRDKLIQAQTLICDVYQWAFQRFYEESKEK